jgi:radical SAM protein with 4Fe4S-binding SPASM domain
MSVYPENHIKKIFCAGLLDKLVISFYGVDKETYNLLQPPLDYEQTIANIKRIVKYKHQLRWNTPKIFLEVLVTTETHPKIGQFIRNWAKIVDKVGVSPLNSWNGTVKVDYDLMEHVLGKPAVRVPCFRPFTSLNIHFDGAATMCCMDYNDEYVVGNVFEDWDLWQNSKKLQDIRQLHSEGRWDEIPLCKECSAWRYNFPSQWVEKCLKMKQLPVTSAAKQ